MERTFDLEAIANRVIIYRGLCVKPNTKFRTIITENDLNNFKPFIEILSCKELCAESQKSNPIMKKEQKESVNNDNTRKVANSTSKVQNTTKVSVANK